MKTDKIADLVSGTLQGDRDVEINHGSDIAAASADSLAFTTTTDNVVTAAGCVLAIEGANVSAAAVIFVKDPRLAFAIACEVLHPAKTREPEIHPTAIISRSAIIGERVYVGALVTIGDGSSIGDGCQIRSGAHIGDNVKIGARCTLDPGVFVEDNCTIGNDVILHSGVVIGTDGFGFARDRDRYVKFPQIGTVVIEDNVEIGANSCVDRGALGETRIGEGTKIDNLVQIAHNVTIGKHCVIAAQTGISGSTVIEDNCVIGGQVGMGDHARVQSGAVIGSQAGVLPGKIVRPGVWWGTPVQPLDEYKRQNAHVKSLGRMKDELKSLRSRIDKIERNEE
ncbi:MAG TPA: UDP-3-O-(3-hydroxymyristoyl)glucosamine N-acyltransferase [Pyrinomonadaceae bacterium]|nr:UDP-3-O-(3-hydroxymyristoyl)glucosamine N-acyltransferase [Chloracidobacterium sp.]MBP9936171.1 UDP-3-O-(3-hydroxymyristoyl)glucosamine N-acyltransferase [Pyrinomonadaceae bacterium]MBK7804489.1 UDP-3-O-(3-hydroxymyristoyl)glucosamine N-acyltransferase [Chloracidobacterium sp.]MBK9438890.1 UDP-3-O-(3-hydroxymyristoyl)glucosamine N-acyltransferase [Chloracidobacterium sp.]MBL0240421.1 UDP-3-O-(3-hydroxymyristoyl)glucosamine N-acyltransferase [Chloracidobacterium sp.]